MPKVMLYKMSKAVEVHSSSVSVEDDSGLKKDYNFRPNYTEVYYND